MSDSNASLYKYNYDDSHDYYDYYGYYSNLHTNLTAIIMQVADADVARRVNPLLPRLYHSRLRSTNKIPLLLTLPWAANTVGGQW